MSTSLQQSVVYSDIPVCMCSDHAPVEIKLNIVGASPGKGYWKLNNQLLADDQLCDQITQVIEGIFCKHKKSDICMAWELMKMEVRAKALKRGIDIAKS